MSASKEMLAGEALLFHLVGNAFSAAPERAWLESLVQTDVFAESPFGGDQPDAKTGLALLQAWCQENREGIAEFETLQAEYTRLFIGPGPVVAPPWESVYFSPERLVFQKETYQVRAWYARFGLQSANYNKEPDDHIALELSFVAYLAEVGLQALEACDQERFQETLEEQRRFLENHLLKWGPAWCSRVEKTSTSAFYRGLALLTRGGLSEIRERLIPGTARV